MTMKRPGSRRTPPTRAASASSCCLTPAATSAFCARNSSTTAGEVGVRTQLGRLEGAAQVEVVGAAAADDDARAGPVDLVVVGQRRGVANQVGAFDQDVGRGEADAVAAQRIDREEADVGLLRLHRLDRSRGGVDDDELDRHAELVGERAREVDRDADTAPVAGVAARQDRIAEVDRRAQAPGRRERRRGVGRGGRGGVAQPAAASSSDAPPPARSVRRERDGGNEGKDKEFIVA